MRWSPDDEYDESGHDTGLTAMIAIMAVVTILILGIVIYLNRYELGLVKRASKAESVVSVETEESSGNSDTSKKEYLTAQDLTFWNMYPEKTEEQASNQAAESEEETETTEIDETNDGKHTKIVNRDGKEEWIPINNYLKKNKYDLTKFSKTNQLMKYTEDGEVITSVGVDVSKTNSYVDYNALKKAGVTFVMIRVGARGYETGKITMDEYFQENMRQASEAGMNIGLTFYSQAISLEEAVEEVVTIVNSIGEYKVTYPIAIDMEYVSGDSSRIEKLSREEKTNVILQFCQSVQQAGFIPAVYGDKSFLLKDINLNKLSDYDIWLSQPGDQLDYPYELGMWQYEMQGEISGINGPCHLNLSFHDYTLK